MAAVAKAQAIGNTFSNEEITERVIYDFAVDGGAVGALDLFTASADVVITYFHAYVKTTATSGGSATLAVGITGTTSKYVNTTAGAVANLTANALLQPEVVETEGTPNVVVLPVPHRLASGAAILQTIGTAALTAGKIEYVIKYFRA